MTDYVERSGRTSNLHSSFTIETYTVLFCVVFILFVLQCGVIFAVYRYFARRMVKLDNKHGVTSKIVSDYFKNMTYA